MYSDDEKVVLCGASAYEQKYYFNQDFNSLPEAVKKELQDFHFLQPLLFPAVYTSDLFR